MSNKISPNLAIILLAPVVVSEGARADPRNSIGLFVGLIADCWRQPGHYVAWSNSGGQREVMHFTGCSVITRITDSGASAGVDPE